MSDDLVKRLRICAAFDPDQAEAADRIEKLEEALQRIVYYAKVRNVRENSKADIMRTIAVAALWRESDYD